MKRGRLVLGLTLLLFCFAAPTFADEVAEQLESIVVDSLDDPEQRVWQETGLESKEARKWVAAGSKFTVEGFPILQFVEGSGTFPDALFGTNPNKLPLKSLGIAASFKRQGYNYVELYPVKADASGALVPSSINLPGISKQIDFWVWGSNFRLTLDIHVRDYRGIPFVLHAGSLNHQGWKNFRVNVPASVPQTQPYLPRYKGLELTKMVIHTDPTEKVEKFYVYIDHLKVLTDMHQNPFDGKDLLNEEFINKYFATSQKEGN